MRPLLYLLAAELFEQPTPQQSERLRNMLARVIYRAPPDARWVAPLLEIADDSTPVPERLAEWKRLFTGDSPTSIALASAHWLPEGAELVPAPREVALLMHRYGLDDAGWGGERPHQLPCELKLMAHLAHDPEAKTRPDELRMLERRLAAWVPRFTSAVRAARPSHRLAMAAIYLERLLTWDLARIARERTRVTSSPDVHRAAS